MIVKRGGLFYIFFAGVTRFGRGPESVTTSSAGADLVG